MFRLVHINQVHPEERAENPPKAGRVREVDEDDNDHVCAEEEPERRSRHR